MKFETLTNQSVEASKESYLLDFQGEGELLAVCFGFYDANGNAQFDFYKRLKKLEALSGKKINKLLLRDRTSAWYLRGVDGLGADVDSTIDEIKKVITQVKPSRVITIGQSMGGYAAILYGALLNADQAISFGPLSCFDSKKLEILRDYRWLPLVKKLEENPPKPFYNDLPKLIRDKKPKTEFNIFYGTNPGEMGDRNEGVNYDAAHALAFHGLAKLFPLHHSPHAVVEYMRVNKIINEALLKVIFGIHDNQKEPLAIGAEWAKWLHENIRLGCSDKQLLDALMQNNFSQEAAKAAVAAVHAERDLAKILDVLIVNL